MATTVERIGIVETKVENLSEKLDDLKVDVKEMHDCLDKTRDDLSAKLDKMYDASCAQHAELNHKIEQMEKLKQFVQKNRNILTKAGTIKNLTDELIS